MAVTSVWYRSQASGSSRTTGTTRSESALPSELFTRQMTVDSMPLLDDVPVDALRDALDEVEAKTPAMRLVAAIAYKRGVTQTELATWFGVERKTVYNWLSRLDAATGSMSEAARDDHRGGRPARLDRCERRRLCDVLGKPPTAAGYDRAHWTTALVGRHVEDAFGVSYSPSSLRRLMRDCGLRPADPDAAGGDRWTSED